MILERERCKREMMVECMEKQNVLSFSIASTEIKSNSIGKCCLVLRFGGSGKGHHMSSLENFWTEMLKDKSGESLSFFFLVEEMGKNNVCKKIGG